MAFKILIFGVFLSLNTITFSNGNKEQQKICIPLESVYVAGNFGVNRSEVQTIPGKMGPKGDRGIPGPKGSKGEIDYDELEVLVNQKVETAMRTHIARRIAKENELRGEIVTLERKQETRVREAIESQRAERTEEFNELQAEIVKFRKLQQILLKKDAVSYNGKVFLPLASDRVNKATAISKCRQLGGVLANVYNQYHMNKIIDFVRAHKMGSESWKYFWLGMTYNPSRRQLYLRDGTSVSRHNFKWYSGYPASGSSYTNMFLEVHKKSSSSNQYFFNYPERSEYVLCEI